MRRRADPGVRLGARLGVDVGSVRIGVAASDRQGTVAVPVATVRRDRRGTDDLRRLAELAAERDVTEVVVGLPRTLAGTEGPAAEAARVFARALAALVAPVAVRLVDERLTTALAGKDLRAAGVDARRARQIVDQMAAVAILRGALDAERATGAPPGDLIEVRR